MPARTKRVNVTTVVAVRTTNPPICGTLKNIEMTTGDILKCLCKRAFVEEILSDGSTVRLNMKNYYTDNEPVVAAAAPISVKPEPEVKKIDVEAETEKGGDTHESVEEIESAIIAEPDAPATTEDTVVESVEESAEEVGERDEAAPEHEEAAIEVAGGSDEEAVEETVTVLNLTDKVELGDEAAIATVEPEASVEEAFETAVNEEVVETSAPTAPNTNTAKKKKK